MEFLFNTDEFNNILNNLTDNEIKEYEETPVDNKLLSWVKENFRSNYLSLKKQSLIDNIVNSFDKDENLEEYFNVWNYSTDNLRMSMILFDDTHAAALPTNDWAKNATFILSNKNLYIINSGQYFDYISTDIINFNNLSNLKKIKLYKHKDTEILEFNFNTQYKKLYKTNKEYLSSLFKELQANNAFKNKLKYMKDKKLPKGLFHYVSYYFIIISIIAMFMLIYFYINKLH